MLIAIKQADRNLGFVSIRGDIYPEMLRKWLVPPSFERTNMFPHDHIRRRIKIITKFKRSIPEKSVTSCVSDAKKAKHPSPFYFILKINRKAPLASRPITAQHLYMLSQLSKDLLSYSLYNYHSEGWEKTPCLSYKIWKISKQYCHVCPWPITWKHATQASTSMMPSNHWMKTSLQWEPTMRFVQNYCN